MALEWSSVPCLESGTVPPQGIWHEVPASGVGIRIGSSANFLKDNSVLLIGGAGEEGPVNKVHRLDLSKVQWTTLNSANFPPRYEHSTLSWEGSVYVFGGAKVEGPLGDMWKYSQGEDSWSRVETGGCEVPPRTTRCAAVQVGRLVVFGGGHTGDRPAQPVGPYLYTCSANQWSRPEAVGSAPTARHGHVCACVGGRVYVHGGMAGQEFFSDLYMLDLAAWKWSVPKVGGEVPSPRAAHGVAVYGDRVYMFGGVGPEGAINELLLLNTGLGLWSKIETHCTPSPRLDMAMCSISLPGQPANTSGESGTDAIFIYGGFDTAGAAFDDCYILVL